MNIGNLVLWTHFEILPIAPICLILFQVEDFLGTAMTYSLFEWVKENYDDLISEQPETAPAVGSRVIKYETLALYKLCLTK